MDILKKIELIERPPTEEIVTRDELIELLKTNSRPKHYIGIELSGFLHLGSLISTGFKINDFIKAGVDCTVFLADWHTLINDKLGGNWDAISKVSQYYAKAFKTVCPGVKIMLGSDLYDSQKEYWLELIHSTRRMTLKRIKRTLTIMGRSQDDEKIDLAKLLYPPMQALDIHFLDVDIAHAGMDQRKIHMLAREYFPKMGWKVPIAIHHALLPGLGKPTSNGSNVNKEINKDIAIEKHQAQQKFAADNKMSKSDPKSGIFIHDTDDEINSKLEKAWCEIGNIENNPLLSISKYIIFHEVNEFNIERPEKFGGNITFFNYEELESAFAAKKIHPSDFKLAVTKLLIKIISPIRDKVSIDDDLVQLIKKSV